MEIEHQVVSLELAKQLKKNNYPQGGSYFVFIDTNDDNQFELISRNQWEIIEGEWGSGRDIEDFTYFAAPSVAELGEKLPAAILIEKKLAWLTIVGGGELWWETRYTDSSEYDVFPSQSNIKEADSRAQMWIYLKENGLLPMVG